MNIPSRLFAARGQKQTVLKKYWHADMDEHYIIKLKWSHNSQRLAAASADGPIGIFDRSSGNWVRTLPGHGIGTLVIDWHPTTEILASGGQDGKICLWDVTAGALQATLDGGGMWVERVAWMPATQSRVLRGRSTTVLDQSSEALLLASTAGKLLRLWRVDGTIVRETRDHVSTIADIAWMPVNAPLNRQNKSPNERTATAPVLVCATYGGLTLWRTDQDEPIGRYQWKGSTLVIACSPNGQFIASGDQDSTVHFWITRTELDLQMWGYATKVRELAWDHTSRYLATGGGSVVTVWDCSGKGPEGTRPLQFDIHEGQISALSFQHRGMYLASGCSDGLVVVWAVGQSKKPKATLQFDGAISQLSWSHDDQLLAVGTERGDVAVLSMT
jgi:WD40 repeat protein